MHIFKVTAGQKRFVYIIVIISVPGKDIVELTLTKSFSQLLSDVQQVFVALVWFKIVFSVG